MSTACSRCPAPIAVLALCGLLQPPAAATATADLEARIALAFGEAIVGAALSEAQGTHEFDYLGTQVRIDILGMAFCQPPDPWVPPDPGAAPPNSGYGCRNSPAVAASVTSAEDGAAVTLTLETIFLDLATTRTRSMLCGELGGGTVSHDGYLLSSAVVTADFNLAEDSGCVQAALVPGSVHLAMGEATAALQDGCLASYWSAMAPDLLPDLEASLQQAMAALIAGRMDAFNAALCTLADAQGLSWSGLKALYGSGRSGGSDGASGAGGPAR